MQKSEYPEGHKSMISYLNVIKKRGQKEYNQGNVDYDKHTEGINNH